MAKDWLKLHRKALDSQVFSDPSLWHLFCWCLLRANWKAGWFEGVEIKPGSFATGRNAAAAELDMNPSTWYKRIQKLVELKLISVSGNNRFTLITVQKWAHYQSAKEDGNSEVTTEEQPSNSQVTTKEQPDNTIEEGNKAIREEGKKLHTHSQRKIDESKIDPELLPHWRRWCEWYLIANSVEIDQIQGEEILMNLGRRGTQKAIRDISFSIFKGAKSILDSDNDFQARNRTTAGKPKVILQ